jgi:hypothetical protein
LLSPENCVLVLMLCLFKIHVVLVALRLHWPVCPNVSQVRTSWRRFETRQGRRAPESGQQWQRWSTVYLWHWLGSQCLLGACPRCWTKGRMQAAFWRDRPLPSTQETKNSSLNILDRFATLWFFCIYSVMVSHGSSVGIATGYGLDDWRVRVWVPVGSRIFASPYRTDRLRVPPSLLSNWYGVMFPGCKAAGAWSWPLTSN